MTLVKSISLIYKIGMTDLRRLDFTMLMTFDALYEERSVTKAAGRLSVTQPTVSGTLSRLRDLFSDPLFIRSRAGMLPTPRADEISMHVKRMIRDAEGVFHLEPFDPSKANLTFRISANDYGLRAIVMPLLKELRVEAPGIKLAVLPFETGELAVKLANRSIDIAITVPEMAPVDYPSRFLFSDSYVAVVRKEHAIKGSTITLDEFCALDHVLVSPTGGSFEGLVDEALRELGRRRRVVYSVSSFQIVPEILQLDDLIAVVPERLLDGSNSNVRKLSVPVSIRKSNAILVWHPRLTHDHAFSWLRNQFLSSADHTAC